MSTTLRRRRDLLDLTLARVFSPLLLDGFPQPSGFRMVGRLGAQFVDHPLGEIKVALLIRAFCLPEQTPKLLGTLPRGLNLLAENFECLFVVGDRKGAIDAHDSFLKIFLLTGLFRLLL